MTFHDPTKRPFKLVLPGMRTRTFWGDNQLLSLVDLDANTILPPHSHPHEQSTFVLEGELTFEIEGQETLVRAGEIMIIPGGVEHLARVGPSPARVLDVFTPVREDLKY
jgi:quercetin dioxygenase-like cupin family protein